MATAITPFGKLGVFSDEVFTATDLNRRVSEVFKSARKRPVTIARNNEQYALIRREQASELVKALNQLGEAVQLFLGVSALKDGSEPPSCVAWIKAFDEDDRASMLAEVFAACSRSGEGGDWDSVGDAIHEWHESALVAQSGVLRDAMDAEGDEQPLPMPSLAESDK